MRVRLRRLWLSVHRWIGLVAGLVFVFLGLTGSLLVFDHAIDEWLNPQLLLTEGSGTPRPIEQIIAAAESAYGDGSQKALSATVPRVANGVWSVWFAGGTEAAPKFTAVHVDPYTGHVTGQRVWGEYLMTWVYQLHFQFFAGPIGGTLVGLAGIVMLLSVVSGVVLWWPLLKAGIRAAFALRGGGKLTYDLHKTVGIFSAVLLLVIAFTGVYMEFPHAFQNAAGALAEMTQPPNCKSAAKPDAARITADEAVSLAAQRFPNARFDHLHPPEGRDGVYEIAFRQPGEIQQSYGRTLVYLDQYTGDVLALYTPRDFTAADVFFAWQFPLHNGEAFGLVGRWVVFFVGLAPALLYVTGFLLWWRKRQARHRQQQRKDAPASTLTTAAAPPPRQLAQELAAPVGSGTRK